MSVVAVSAPSIKAALGNEEALGFFFISLGLAIACALIGIEMMNLFDSQGIEKWGLWGMFLLVLLVPVTFAFIVGKIMMPSWNWNVGTWSAPATTVLVAITGIAILLILFYLMFIEE
jgi:hypothetical protein